MLQTLSFHDFTMGSFHKNSGGEHFQVSPNEFAAIDGVCLVTSSKWLSKTVVLEIDFFFSLLKQTSLRLDAPLVRCSLRFQKAEVKAE